MTTEITKKKRKLSRRKSDILKRKEKEILRNREKKLKAKNKAKLTNKKYVYNGKFVPFIRAKQIVKKLSLQSAAQYKDWYIKNNPNYLPKNPNRAYKKEWKGWVEFLDKNSKHSINLSKKIKQKKEYKKQKELSNSNKIKQLKKSVNAEVKFKLKYAKNYFDSLKTKELEASGKYKKQLNKKIKIKKPKIKPNKNKPSKYMPYEMAIAYLKDKKLKSMTEYKAWYKASKPENLPYNPYKVYDKVIAHEFLSCEENKKIDQFISYRDKWREYDKAIRFVHALNLKTAKEWDDYYISGKIPKDIPRFPHNVYKYRPNDPSWGKWTSWTAWLGSENINNYLEAKKEELKIIMFIVPQNLPLGIYTILYKTGFKEDIYNFIDDNELYVIRIYKINQFDWKTYVTQKYSNYMGQENMFIIANINDLLFDFDDYMEQL